MNEETEKEPVLKDKEFDFPVDELTAEYYRNTAEYYQKATDGLLRKGTIKLVGPLEPPVLTQEQKYRQWFSDEVKKFSYKPEFRIEVLAGSYTFTPLIYLTITMRTKDTYHPERTLDVVHQVHIPVRLYADPRAFATWVLTQLVVLEVHEATEWFKVDGEIHLNPHTTLGASFTRSLIREPV